MLLVIKDNKVVGIHVDQQNIDKKLLSFYEAGSSLMWVNDDFKYNPPLIDTIDKQNGLPIPPITQEREFIMIGDDAPTVSSDFITKYYKELRDVSYEYYGDQLDIIVGAFKLLKDEGWTIGQDMEDLIERRNQVKLMYPKP